MVCGVGQSLASLLFECFLCIVDRMEQLLSMETQLTQELLGDICKRLAVGFVAVEPILGGSNNRLFRATTTDGAPLLIKQYFSDDRRRLEREHGVLSILNERGFDEVPRPILAIPERRVGVYSFIEGSRLTADAFTEGHIDAIANYLAKVHRITPDQVPQVLPMAQSSARSLGEVIKRIEERLYRCNTKLLQQAQPSVKDFLEETQVLYRVRCALDEFLAVNSEDAIDLQITPENLRLSSADFGPHNMLWRPDGQLVVIDFEYGGWDHPLRVIGDFLAHDKTQAFKPGLADCFVQCYLQMSSLRPEILSQIELYGVLSRIEWITIYLTAMLPEKLVRLRFAKGEGFDMQEYVDEQMKAVRVRLKTFDKT